MIFVRLVKQHKHLLFLEYCSVLELALNSIPNSTRVANRININIVNNTIMFFYVDTRTWAYQQRCLTHPIQSSAIGAIIFSAIDVFQGVPLQQVIAPRSLGEFGAFF